MTDLERIIRFGLSKADEEELMDIAKIEKAGIKILPTWQELFPEGRLLYYEGATPDKFVAEMKEKFGFDPLADNPEWNEEDGYVFFCPPNVLDKIYGTGEYPLGS